MEKHVTSERYHKGMQQLERQFGVERADEMIKNLSAVYEFFARVNVEFPFGDLYTRDSVLSLKTREIATIAALTAQGFSLPQLRIHLIGALKAGVTRIEILEIITQMIAYAGFPAATNALLTAQQLFEDVDKGDVLL